MRTRTILSGAVLSVLSVVSISGFAYAALTDSTLFSQQVDPGTLSTFIGDASGAEVAAPNVPFTSVDVSNAVQTSTATYGTGTERIYVDNPGGADTGWVLSLAATGGATATWSNGADTYAYNAATAANGQLTLNPSAGSLVAESGATTGITLGSSATFLSGSVDSIELLNADATSDNINRVYLTGVAASQTIPAMTPAGSYTLDFTQTVATQ